MNDELLSLLIGLALGALLATLISLGVIKDIWRRDAVKRGFAEYNSQTGAWQWRTKEAVAKDYSESGE